MPPQLGGSTRHADQSCEIGKRSLDGGVVADDACVRCWCDGIPIEAQRRAQAANGDDACGILLEWTASKTSPSLDIPAS